ncbi:MAG: thiamine phosphate synthase [Stenotrophomonas sp.]
MTQALALRGVYLITPDTHDTAVLLATTAPLLAAGVALLQYRNKTADAALQLTQARALQALCREHGVPLVVNDDLALAREVGAAGVHLGINDGDIASARAALGAQAIIGASCYNQIDLARKAAAAGASYVGFGAFFPSPTKPHAPRADVQQLHDSAGLGVTRVAIGGLSPDNAGALVAAGADLLAVVSGIYAAADPLAALRAYHACLEGNTR